MGSTAKFGLLVLMALIIALARFLESEVKPTRAQTLTITRPAGPARPVVPIDPRRSGPANRTPVNRTPANVTPANVTPANVTPVNVTPVNVTPAPPTPPKPRTYTVQKRRGEVLSRISRDVYGSQRYWRLILKANRSLLKGDPRKLRPGMVLTIPPKPEAN